MAPRMKMLVAGAVLVGAVVVVATPHGRVWFRQQDSSVRSFIHEVRMLHPSFRR